MDRHQPPLVTRPTVGFLAGPAVLVLAPATFLGLSIFLEQRDVHGEGGRKGAENVQRKEKQRALEKWQRQRERCNENNKRQRGNFYYRLQWYKRMNTMTQAVDILNLTR